MNDSVRIRSGALNGRAEMPRLKYAETINGEKHGAEIGFNTEEKAIYTGTDSGNVKVGDSAWEERIKTCESQITAINARIDELNVSIAEIIARLDALTTPSE